MTILMLASAMTLTRQAETRKERAPSGRDAKAVARRGAPVLL
jgi:hypothetical protein